MSLSRNMILASGSLAVLGAGLHAADDQGADASRALAAEAMADAAQRSSLLSGSDAGYDGKFFLSGEGFRLGVGGQVQFRYYLSFRDDSAEDDFDPGFSMPRTRLWFDGVVADDYRFYVRGNFDRDNGVFELQDAYVSWDVMEDWALNWGQVKAPITRETIVDSSHQLAVERSLTDYYFGGGRTQAIWLSTVRDDYTLAIAFGDGANTANTDFTSPSEADVALTARGQWKVQGTWDQFDDFTSPQGSEMGIMLGGAVHWQDGPTLNKGSQTNDPTDVDARVLVYTVDASFEGDGWNAFAAFYGRKTVLDSLAGRVQDTNDLGVVVQGGYRIQEFTELFARYEGMFLDDEVGIDNDSFNFLTVGVNQYYAGHAAKATVDLLWAFDETEDLVSLGILPNTLTGQLGDMEKNEVTVRFQFQLLF